MFLFVEIVEMDSKLYFYVNISNQLFGSAFSRPNSFGNTRGQFSPPGRAVRPGSIPPVKKTYLLGIASNLGGFPINFVRFCVKSGRFFHKFCEILRTLVYHSYTPGKKTYFLGFPSNLGDFPINFVRFCALLYLSICLRTLVSHSLV